MTMRARHLWEMHRDLAGIVDGERRMYLTVPLPCPYLEGHVEQKLCTPVQCDSQYRKMIQAGFRRNLMVAYLPACPKCSGCVPVRVRARDFRPRGSLARTARHYQALEHRIVPALADPEHYALFSRYVRVRHAEGTMAGMDFDQYRMMIEHGPASSRLMTLRAPDTGVLRGVCLFDCSSDGWSAVYSFFDPAETRGLGSYIIMRLIETCVAAGGAYLYLGFWIRESPKMSYKIRFRPLEAMNGDGHWAPLVPGGGG